MASEIVVPKSERPKSLENFLKRRFPIGYLRKLFRKNGVRLNGKRSGPKEMVEPGDRIQLFIPFEKRTGSTNKKRPACSSFEILFEDSELLLINKRAGIAVHEGKGILKRNSLLGKLEAAYRPQFSPAHGCGSASTRIYGVAVGQRARRTVQYAYALCLSRVLYLQASALPHFALR